MEANKMFKQIVSARKFVNLDANGTNNKTIIDSLKDDFTINNCIINTKNPLTKPTTNRFATYYPQ